MKKFNRKSTIVLIGVTILLVAFSSLLLKSGIYYSSKTGMEKLENVEIDEIPIEPISNQYKSRNDSLIENPKPIDKVKQEDFYNSVINGAKRQSEKATPYDREKQEAIYQAVKDKINIQKEVAKEVFKQKIFDIFGDLLDISDDQLIFLEIYVAQDNSYEWSLVVENDKDKKWYWCGLNAMTGEFTRMSKYDYTGFGNSSEGCYITWVLYELKNNKINLYTNKVKEIIKENNILDAKDNGIKSISIKYTFYAGLRPFITMEAKMQDKRKVEMAFYVDTDELVYIYVIPQY